MAVTLTQAQLSAALRLGDSDEEGAEATRLLAYATEAVTQRAPFAPTATQNEAVVRLAAYLYDQPTASRGDNYANAMRNSGAGRMLLPWVEHRLGSTAAASGTAAQEAAGLGLRLLGSEAVDVATAQTWTATGLPVPRSAVAGAAVCGPDGRETGIELFRTANFDGSAAEGGDASGPLATDQYALGTGADGSTMFFASRRTGRHFVYLYGPG